LALINVELCRDRDLKRSGEIYLEIQTKIRIKIECEIQIIRVMNISGDSGDLHSFVIAEFPYPKESRYGQNRRSKRHKKSRFRRPTAFECAIKNKGIFILLQKGGFLRSDKVQGAAILTPFF